MSSKRRVLFSLIMTAMLMISACNHHPTHLAKIQNSSTGSTDCHVIQHAMGQVCVPNHPKRIVALDGFTLGHTLLLGSKPIGSTTLSPLESQFPVYLQDKTDGIESIGTEEQPSLEKILSLKPDLIIGSDSSATFYDTLSNIAPTALFEWKNIESWRSNFSFVADVLGKQDVAQQAWEHYYQRIRELKLALGDRVQSKTISCMFFYFGRIGVQAKNSFIGSILNEIGLQRPISQNSVSKYGYINLSNEELEKADGNILFITTSRDSDEQRLERLKQQPIWKQLKAVQQNHVYVVDESIWTGGDLLAADAVLDDLYKYLANTL